MEVDPFPCYFLFSFIDHLKRISLIYKGSALEKKVQIYKQFFDQWCLDESERPHVRTIVMSEPYLEFTKEKLRTAESFFFYKNEECTNFCIYDKLHETRVETHETKESGDVQTIHTSDPTQSAQAISTILTKKQADAKNKTQTKQVPHQNNVLPSNEKIVMASNTKSNKKVERGPSANHMGNTKKKKNVKSESTPAKPIESNVEKEALLSQSTTQSNSAHLKFEPSAEPKATNGYVEQVESSHRLSLVIIKNKRVNFNILFVRTDDRLFT